MKIQDALSAESIDAFFFKAATFFCVSLLDYSFIQISIIKRKRYNKNT